MRKEFEINEYVYDVLIDDRVLIRHTNHKTGWEHCCPFYDQMFYSGDCDHQCKYNKDKCCSIVCGVRLTPSQLTHYLKNKELIDDRFDGQIRHEYKPA